MMRVAVDRIAAVMHAALVARDVADDHARDVVAGLITASLRGVDTHGVRLFPTYLAELDGGRARARPVLTWSGTAATRRLDAGGALGIVAGMAATREAIAVARDHGIAAIAVGNSNHFGAASAYTLEIARAGMIGVCCSNADALMAPFAGIAALFGTNPLSVCAPGVGDDVFCLDMATSQIAYSQLKAHLARGQALPAGWALRPDGSDAAGATTAAEVGAMAPLGGYKGQGLAMAVAILSGVLATMPLDHELTHLYTPPFDEARRVSHLILAIDVAAFLPVAAFRQRLTQYLDHVRGQAAVAGAAVHVPGDLEAAATRDRRDHGIPLGDDEVLQFRGAGVPL